jgi:hypothetical protein
MKPSLPKLALVLGGLLTAGMIGPADADRLHAQPGPYSYNYGPIYYPGPGPVAVGVPPVYRVPPPLFVPPLQAQRRNAWPNATRGPSCYTQLRWVFVETVGYRKRNALVCY